MCTRRSHQRWREAARSARGYRAQLTGAEQTPSTTAQPGPSPYAETPAGSSRRGSTSVTPVTRVSPTVSTLLNHKALTRSNAPDLDHVDARRRFRLAVPCRTAGLAPQHHRSRTKIRTRCGPTRLSSRRFHPLPQVRGDGERVPPADEEPAGGPPPDPRQSRSVASSASGGLASGGAPCHCPGHPWGESGEFGRRWGARGENRLRNAARA